MWSDNPELEKNQIDMHVVNLYQGVYTTLCSSP